MLRERLETLYQRRDTVDRLIQVLETQQTKQAKPEGVSLVPIRRNRENRCNAAG